MLSFKEANRNSKCQVYKDKTHLAINVHILLYKVGKGRPNKWFLYVKLQVQKLLKHRNDILKQNMTILNHIINHIVDQK